MSTANTTPPQLASAPQNSWVRSAGSWHAVSAAAATIGYLLSVVAANITSVHWPPIVVAGLVIPAGTVFAGTSLTARDLVHDRLGARGVAMGTAAGAGLSAVLASPQIAVASVVAFTASEILDALIYTRLRHRSRLRLSRHRTWVGSWSTAPCSCRWPSAASRPCPDSSSAKQSPRFSPLPHFRSRA